MAAKVCFGSAGDLGLRCLPPEIFRMILQYLDVPNEIRVLDEAILNHELRSLYLQSLHGMTIEEFSHVIPSPQSNRKAIVNIYWLLNKNIRPLNIRISDYLEGILFLIFQSRFTLTTLSIDFKHSFPIKFTSDLARIGHFPSLTSLVIDDWPETSASDFVTFCSKNTQLQSLHIRSTDFSSEILSSFLPFCESLLKLEISYNQRFNDECIEALVTATPKLQWLSVAETPIQSLQSIKSILDSFSSLRYFDLTFCSELSLNAKKYYVQEFCVPMIRSRLKSYNPWIEKTLRYHCCK
jgi:hypothetical protein